MSLAGKSGYKETKVGWIPSNWRCEHLGGHISMLTGAPFKSELFSSSEGVPLIRIRDLLRGFSETCYAGEYDERYIVNTGDVLVGMDGEFHVVRWKGSRALLNQRVLKISHRPGISDLGFLFFFVAAAIGKIQDGISATTVKHLSTKDLQNLTAALPPLPEQQKIAAILTAVDDKMDVIARQIEATQTLKRGLMQTLFSRGVGTQDTDGRWVQHTEFKRSELGKVPATWSIRTLGSVTEEVKKRNFGILDDALLCGVLKEQGLMPMRERVKGAKTERCRVVWPNAFAYNPMRINIGSIARNLRDHSVMVSPDYVVFATRTDELLPDYLDHFRRSDEWQRFVGRSGDGGVRIRIYYDDLAQLRLKVPPLPEQERIVEILDGLTAKLSHLASKHAHYQTLKRGLMQKLLTGEWRVNVDASASGN